MNNFRLPPEWAQHRATWLAWPHNESDWPSKFQAIPFVFAEIARLLARSEQLELVCNTEDALREAREALRANSVDLARVNFHVFPNDRSWLRDSAPTALVNEQGQLCWLKWGFNGWAKYDNHTADSDIATRIVDATNAASIQAFQSGQIKFGGGSSSGSNTCVSQTNAHPMPGKDDAELLLVMEGGVFDTDGEGTLLVTEECLLSSEQERNPGFTKDRYESMFRAYLGVEKVIWLNKGIAGDDTHGHIDDLARFVAPGVVLLAQEANPGDPNYEPLMENLIRLTAEVDAKGRSLKVIPLPMPAPVVYNSERLPASYANFYICNKFVLVPTFNDPNDVVALSTIQSCFPTRQVVPVYARDLVLGLGTLHCLTQQEPMVGIGTATK